MKTKIRLVLLLLLVLLITAMSFLVLSDTPQYGEYTHSYILPKEPDVLEKLEEWQDQKFGMLIHYGLYSELATVESWELIDEEWIHRNPPVRSTEYQKYYWGAVDRFAPTDLDPESWAKYGKEAGMKYVVFTTKHHDGFNMFDTKQSDFSITKFAFKDHPRKDITKEVFNAFRNEGYMIGAYYSKPDWHSEYYWSPDYESVNRHVNYSIDKEPERWEKFKEFTYNQIEELVNGDYGNIDILWLDGGWVRPARPTDKEEQGDLYKGVEDIDMPKIATMARSYQPGILVVDRTVGGEFENYLTLEYAIPEVQMGNPSESCVPLIKGSWGFINNASYKSHYEIISNLAEVVAKGGNLLLGVGPAPDGTLPEDAIKSLQEIGKWTSKNGEAIYSTRTVSAYQDGQTWFTRSKDSKKVYAIRCLEEGKPLPATIIWNGNEPKEGSKMVFLQTGEEVQWQKTKNGIEVVVPANLPEGQPALAFSFTPDWGFKFNNFKYRVQFNTIDVLQKLGITSPNVQKEEATID